MDVVYRLCSEDVLSFVSNRENGEEVLNQVRRSFSCMEELQVFVEVVESAINSEKREKFTQIEVEANHLDLVENYPEAVKLLATGTTLLVLETANHLFQLSLAQDWGDKFLTYDIYRKDYYATNKYTLCNLVSEALDEQIERDSFYEYSLPYFVRLFGEFLANRKEQVELRKDDESAVLVDRDIFVRYLEEDDDTNPDFPKTIKEFLNSYTFDDVQEFLNILTRRGNSYFLYR
ncbi:hypothetical protein ABQD97_20350 [Enterococcus avium]|uniref:Uncharacterized protein n=1 Tax=Enterococcus avium TaxID=33945 RepID=A0AAW8S285_ENTAV|nr:MULTISPECIES: hypothetical protein [Enterococcus]MDT2391725.1 hypothetical protein [Enterococcus avium]MDT2404799.1 hypothetical protein [Enterococcus avium]MDT2437866.1 hypothetical protein [Enterococcus avium]MDT2482656.1 hypothetical protein [Enterococcus avium]MDT2509352.1 hypothetical protein [Enterococcus avium]